MRNLPWESPSVAFIFEMWVNFWINFQDANKTVPPVGPLGLQPRSVLLCSSNDSPPLIRGNKSLISAVTPLTGPPRERGGQTKPAITRRLLTHIMPQQSIFCPLCISKLLRLYCAEQKIDAPVIKWKHWILIFILCKGRKVADLSDCTNSECLQIRECSCERKHSWSRLPKAAAEMLIGICIVCFRSCELRWCITVISLPFLFYRSKKKGLGSGEKAKK